MHVEPERRIHALHGANGTGQGFPQKGIGLPPSAMAAVKPVPRKGASGHDICFIHPKPSAEFPVSGAGALIELVQAPPEVIASAEQAHGKLP